MTTKKAVGHASGASLPHLSIGPEKLSDPVAAVNLEWLETNGLGGFASSTVTGMNSRRYHGLLVAALSPPAGRCVILSKLDETVISSGSETELSTNMYPGAIHPEGYRRIISFNLDPFPRWVFDAGCGLLEKTFIMPRGFNAGAIRYRWIDQNGAALPCPPDGSSLRLRPLLAFRDYHCLCRARDDARVDVWRHENATFMRPGNGLPELVFRAPDFEFNAAPSWYYNFEMETERRRGLDFVEDLFCPGCFEVRFAEAQTFIFFASGHDPSICAAESERSTCESIFNSIAHNEKSTRLDLLRAAGSPDCDSAKRLVLSADSFVARRGDGGRTILAGYHWFTDWGRDAMISLPGIAMATGRPEIAKNILATFRLHMKDGLIPNRFPDAGETPAYNTVDASLWYVIAADSYMRATWDNDFLRETLWPALSEIIHFYKNGTANNIRMDDDFLITAGGPGDQLTWMDAKVGDCAFTPRHGKAVEINALWYNALRVMERLAPAVGDSAAPYKSLAAKTAKSFNAAFWNPDSGCMYDVINEDGPDPAIRPNQIFALSLPRMLLAAEQRRSALEIIERDLLTPFGLRSLSPRDPAYRGAYSGGVWERDSAYHQGTVWGWLIGPYINALLNTGGRSAENLEKARAAIAPLMDHITSAGGLNSVSEIFEGDAPHAPCGCISQAWSVGELLRAAIMARLNKL